jgi:hypothetical protein
VFSPVSRPGLELTERSILCVLLALSLEVERPWYEGEQTPPSNGKVKNAWSCNSKPPYAFLTCRGSTMAKCTILKRNLVVLRAKVWISVN